jgi:hypothetical protein
MNFGREEGRVKAELRTSLFYENGIPEKPPKGGTTNEIAFRKWFPRKTA